MFCRHVIIMCSSIIMLTLYNVKQVMSTEHQTLWLVVLNPLDPSTIFICHTAFRCTLSHLFLYNTCSYERHVTSLVYKYFAVLPSPYPLLLVHNLLLFMPLSFPRPSCVRLATDAVSLPLVHPLLRIRCHVCYRPIHHDEERAISNQTTSDCVQYCTCCPLTLHVLRGTYVSCLLRSFKSGSL